MTDNITVDSNFDRLRLIMCKLLWQTHPAELRDTSIRLYSIFSEITKLEENLNNSIDWQVTLLPSGQAISPIGAARCILDFARTEKFTKGIYNAVRTLQARFPGERIEILYAGCGPYATLAVPLATKFSADEIHLTLLDVHTRSLESARSVFAAFGLEDRVGDYIQADAAEYRHPEPPHLIVTEVMKRTLEKEPQFAVTCNLAPQLRENGIFIPEKITVDACLYRPSTEICAVPADAEDLTVLEEDRRVRIRLGRLIELSAVNTPKSAGNISLPPILINLPSEISENYGLMLSTEVTVFDSLVLKEHDSILTIPCVLRDFNPTKNYEEIEFTYLLGQKPGFKHRFPTVDEIVAEKITD